MYIYVESSSLYAKEMGNSETGHTTRFLFTFVQKIAQTGLAIALLSVLDTGSLTETRFNGHATHQNIPSYKWSNVLYKDEDSMHQENIYTFLHALGVMQFTFVSINLSVEALYQLLRQCFPKWFSKEYKPIPVSGEDISIPVSEVSEVSEASEASEVSEANEASTKEAAEDKFALRNRIGNRNRENTHEGCSTTCGYFCLCLAIVGIGISISFLLLPFVIYIQVGKITIITLPYLLLVGMLSIQSVVLGDQILEYISNKSTCMHQQAELGCFARMNSGIVDSAECLETATLMGIILCSIGYQQDKNVFIDETTQSGNQGLRNPLWSGNEYVVFLGISLSLFWIALILKCISMYSGKTGKNAILSTKNRVVSFVSTVVFYGFLLFGILYIHDFLRHRVSRTSEDLDKFTCDPSDSSPALAFWLDRFPEVYPGYASSIDACRAKGFANIACGEDSYTSEMLMKLFASYLLISGIVGICNCFLWIWDQRWLQRFRDWISTDS